MMSDDVAGFLKCVVIMIVALGIIVIIANFWKIDHTLRQQERLEIAVDEDWDFYLDGNLVDENTLLLKEYAYEFDDVRKIVKLTKYVPRYAGRRSSSFVYVPIIH